MNVEYGVVDLFAGPGGLAEGFASVTRDGSRPFKIALSIEKESSAHQTLRLRSFLRQFPDGFPNQYYNALNEDHPLPDWPSWTKLYPYESLLAEQEALKLELGLPSAGEEIDHQIDRIHDQFGKNVILIGGPPCQAYSLVGRSRNMGIDGYTASADPRHFLYREYIRIIERLHPAVFVMENVKGILSSKVGGERIFDKVLEDLRGVGAKDEGGYELVVLGANGATGKGGSPTPSDFVVRTEEYGLPQARHRVIVVGLRPDIAAPLSYSQKQRGLLTRSLPSAAVQDVLENMPKLRSGLSRGSDDLQRWHEAMAFAMGRVEKELRDSGNNVLLEHAQHYRWSLDKCDNINSRKGLSPNGIGDDCPKDLREWILNSNLHVLPNNETRGHMPSDLARYFFASVYAAEYGVSPKAFDYPAGLAPDHRNWNSGKFVDRFRVQSWGQPSTTVTSHISKDGHYFIHPDPAQCRSLTVREAARLQTFPDDYVFTGNRTQQYVQVGNAVPPFLAKQIAETLIPVIEPTESGIADEALQAELPFQPIAE